VVTPSSMPGTDNTDSGADLDPVDAEDLADEDTFGGLETAFAGAASCPSSARAMKCGCLACSTSAKCLAHLTTFLLRIERSAYY
jgi:hypothetical protein